MRAVMALAIGVLLLPSVVASAVNVIAATATSSSAQSASVSCLMKADCAIAWSPGSADSGANEGIYVQFDAPLDADAVEFVTSVKDSSSAFTLSVNGTVTTKLSSVKPTAAGAGRYAARYAVGGHVKSVFLRLGVRKGGWQNFAVYALRFYLQGKPVDINLPVLAPASVTATSVLEPALAYQPANLFDSRYDFAWATNGKITTGKGESIEIRFNQPQNLSDIIVWNGYQRSEEHYKANGRVSRISLSDGQSAQSIALADKSGSQKIIFTTPLRNVSILKLMMEAVVPGAKYPDVLLSELRFVDDQGRIVIPQVNGIVPASNPATAPFLDRSFSSVVCNSTSTPGDFQWSLRLRHDGSFVIYGKTYDVENSKKTDQVLEGNWDLRGSQVRIFGKRYADTVLQTEYSATARKVAPSIFQSDLKIIKFHDLTEDEKQQLVALIWARMIGDTPQDPTEGTMEIHSTGKSVLAQGSDEQTLLANLVKNLDNLNPWTFSSPVLMDAMLPSDDIGSCADSL